MSLAYPKNAVVAIVDDHADAEDALRALRGAGLTAEDVLPAGPQGPARGERAAGRRSSLLRKAATWLVAEEDRMLQAYDEEIRVGRHIIAVHAVKRQDVQRAASVLATHRAHTIRQFGRWLITDLVPAGGHAMERSPRQPLAAPQEFETVAAHELRATDIFRELSAQQLAEIAAIGRHVRVPMGTCLARQGETGARVYVILEGQVELTTGSPQGEITVRVAGPGESLPLAALLGERTLISTATAMSDIRAMEFSHDAFGDLCRRHPDIGMMVYQAVADILGGRYRKTLTRLVGTFERALRQADAFANV